MRWIFLIACLMAVESIGAPLGKVYRWDNSLEDGPAYALSPTRGETMVLQPRLLSYGSPVDLAGVWTVNLIYKPVGSTNVYSIPGRVLNATNGQSEIVWTSSNELSAATYAYDLLLSGPTTTVVAARGAIKFRDGVATGAQLSTNTPIYILDFAQVQLLNVGHAPFLSAYELQDVRDFIDSVRSGTGDLDAHDVTVRGTLTYTNWPGYLARTSDIPHKVRVAAGANITVTIATNADVVSFTVTGSAGGGGGGGIGSYTNTSINGAAHSNSIYIVDGTNTTWVKDTNGNWRVIVSIPPETEPLWVASSNQVVWGDDPRIVNALTNIPGNWVTSGGTNTWTIDGIRVGYVTTNGIRLLQGTLQLDNYDLLCNVRLYDGSRLSPSLTLQGHPGTIGLYGRGYLGSYCWGWSAGGIEIGLLHTNGINLMATNAAFTGRHVGDAASLTNYPEPLHAAWVTNPVLSSLSITNSGSISVIDAGGTTRFSVDGSSGATAIRGQDTDARYVRVNTNWPDFVLTNVFAGVTNRLWFSDGIVTNKTP